jgi:CHAD domain-containing protein
MEYPTVAKAKPITGLNPQASTHENACIIARTKLNELYSWQEYVDQPYALKELHNMRIAAKRLRYTLEIFTDVLPEECKLALKELEQLQQELGQIHDDDVMIALLRLCLTNLKGVINGKARQNEQKKQAKSTLPPGLLPILLEAKAAPNVDQRHGLEQLLKRTEQDRERHYQEFYQHWQHLQEQNFRERLFATLDQSPS